MSVNIVDSIKKIFNFVLLVAIFVFLVSLLPVQSKAQSMMNTSVRALGMGNAFTAVAADKDSLFYNPSGFARTNGMRFTVIDPYVGLSGLEALGAAQDIQTPAGFSSGLRQLYGSNIGLGGGAKTAFVMPGFGIAAYTGMDGQVSVHNPAFPELNLSYIHDEGFALGAGASIFPGLNTGFVVKRINRAGTDQTYGVEEIATLNPTVIFSNLDNKGVGYSFDWGLEFSPDLPSSPVFSFVWRDIGNTSFKAETGIASPPSTSEEMMMGAALTFDAGLISLTPALDFRYLNDNDMQLGKKINMGFEIGLPFIDIRGGFHQGYYTAGLSFNLGPIELDAATYGVELGEYPGQLEDRRYVVQTTIEFGFDFSFSGANKNSYSARRQKRLKQRR